MKGVWLIELETCPRVCLSVVWVTHMRHNGSSGHSWWGGVADLNHAVSCHVIVSTSNTLTAAVGVSQSQLASSIFRFTKVKKWSHLWPVTTVNISTKSCNLVVSHCGLNKCETHTINTDLTLVLLFWNMWNQQRTEAQLSSPPISPVGNHETLSMNSW